MACSNAPRPPACYPVSADFDISELFLGGRIETASNERARLSFSSWRNDSLVRETRCSFQASCFLVSIFPTQERPGCGCFACFAKACFLRMPYSGPSRLGGLSVTTPGGTGSAHLCLERWAADTWTKDISSNFTRMDQSESQAAQLGLKEASWRSLRSPRPRDPFAHDSQSTRCLTNSMGLSILLSHTWREAVGSAFLLPHSAPARHFSCPTFLR